MKEAQGERETQYRVQRELEEIRRVPEDETVDTKDRKPDSTDTQQSAGDGQEQQ